MILKSIHLLVKLHNTKQIQIKVKSIKKLLAVRKNPENNFEIKKFNFFIFLGKIGKTTLRGRDEKISKNGCRQRRQLTSEVGRRPD